MGRKAALSELDALTEPVSLEPPAPVSPLGPYAVIYATGRVWLADWHGDVGVSLDPVGETWTTHYLGHEGDEDDEPHEEAEAAGEEMVEHFLQHVHKPTPKMPSAIRDRFHHGRRPQSSHRCDNRAPRSRRRVRTANQRRGPPSSDDDLASPGIGERPDCRRCPAPVFRVGLPQLDARHERVSWRGGSA